MPNEIPDIEYIVRYCRPNTIISNQIIPLAFEVRDKEEYISVNWMPNGTDIDAGLEHIRSVFAQKFFGIRSNGRFVVFNVGTIKSHVHKFTGIKISYLVKHFVFCVRLL